MKVGERWGLAAAGSDGPDGCGGLALTGPVRPLGEPW
jgi:hypothetical protein